MEMKQESRGNLRESTICDDVAVTAMQRLDS